MFGAWEVWGVWEDEETNYPLPITHHCAQYLQYAYARSHPAITIALLPTVRRQTRAIRYACARR